jgi:hypothetical protein
MNPIRRFDETHVVRTPDDYIVFGIIVLLVWLWGPLWLIGRVVMAIGRRLP